MTNGCTKREASPVSGLLPQQVRYGIGGFLVAVLERVDIDVHGRRGKRMDQPRGDGLHVNSGGDQESSRSVAQPRGKV